MFRFLIIIFIDLFGCDGRAVRMASLHFETVNEEMFVHILYFNES
jgi:hypothetical protein